MIKTRYWIFIHVILWVFRVLLNRRIYQKPHKIIELIIPQYCFCMSYLNLCCFCVLYRDYIRHTTGDITHTQKSFFWDIFSEATENRHSNVFCFFLGQATTRKTTMKCPPAKLVSVALFEKIYIMYLMYFKDP